MEVVSALIHMQMRPFPLHVSCTTDPLALGSVHPVKSPSPGHHSDSQVSEHFLEPDQQTLVCLDRKHWAWSDFRGERIFITWFGDLVFPLCCCSNLAGGCLFWLCAS